MDKKLSIIRNYTINLRVDASTISFIQLEPWTIPHVTDNRLRITIIPQCPDYDFKPIRIVPRMTNAFNNTLMPVSVIPKAPLQWNNNVSGYFRDNTDKVQYELKTLIYYENIKTKKCRCFGEVIFVFTKDYESKKEETRIYSEEVIRNYLLNQIAASIEIVLRLIFGNLLPASRKS